MKIIFITPKLNFETAGGSVFDIDLKARAFQELGHDVAMVTVYSHANVMPEPLPYPIIEERAYNKSQLHILWDIYRLLKKYESQADFFHIDGHMFLYGAGLYKKLGGKVPIVAFFNRELVVFPQDIPSYDFGLPDAPQPNILRRIKEKIRYHIEACIGTWLANEIEISTFTSPVIQGVYNRFGLNTKYQLINPDLAGGVIIPKERRAKKQSNDVVRLLCAGRLIPTKGFDLAIRAFSLLKNKQGIRLIIAGGGPDEARLKTMVHEAGLEEYIDFTGWLTHDKLFPLFEAVDIFVMPRWRRELTSVVLMEAMSYGLACVIPKSGGVEWQADFGALTFNYDNPESLSAAIGKIATNKTFCEQMSRRAIKRLDDLHYRRWIPPLEKQMVTIFNNK